MGISSAQLWSNIFLILVMAVVIEVSVSGIFSVKLINDVLSTENAKIIKTMLVFLVAFGLCYNLPQLRIFYHSKLAKKLPKMIHIVLTILVLARSANLFHDWFGYLKRKFDT